MIKGLKQGARRAAFAAFCREITQAAPLANDRVRFILFDGRKNVSDPTDGEMPCIRLTFIGGEVSRLASEFNPDGVASIVNQYVTSVSVELWTAGTDSGDSLDIGDAIEDALFPSDSGSRESIKLRLGKFGIRDWHLVREVGPSDLQSYDNAAIKATGTYQYTLVLSDT